MEQSVGCRQYWQVQCVGRVALAIPQPLFYCPRVLEEEDEKISGILSQPFSLCAVFWRV